MSWAVYGNGERHLRCYVCDCTYDHAPDSEYHDAEDAAAADGWTREELNDFCPEHGGMSDEAVRAFWKERRELRRKSAYTL
ncbi:MAG: hypothetical protein LBN00_03810 [Oscillospiraceae bacterium]|jgi:hypothetical protein|nr:hypothetical protein [Oscillospiraceae bacterium]